MKRLKLVTQLLSLQFNPVSQKSPISLNTIWSCQQYGAQRALLLFALYVSVVSISLMR